MHKIGLSKNARDTCARSLRYGKARGKTIALYKNLLVDAPYQDEDFSFGCTIEGAANRSIIVREPVIKDGVICKGVVVITFTKTFSYYLKNIDLKAFNRFFYLVLEPSWSGYADADIFGFCGRAENVLIQSSEVFDRILMNGFPETFVPVSFGASDWVDYELFQSESEPLKEFDVIYIANTTIGKRVLRYLQCIKNIVRGGRVNYRACLVCASWGGAANQLEALIADYQLGDNLVVKHSLSSPEVARFLSMSKVNVLLSYKEGSNRSLFEAMFCNIPVLCLGENIGVNKSYINEQTGMLVSDCQLESTLVWMADNYRRYSPRVWAMKNIAPEITTEKMAAVISGIDGSSTKTSQFLIKANNPEVSYFQNRTVQHEKWVMQVLNLFQKGMVCEDAQLIPRLNNLVAIDSSR